MCIQLEGDMLCCDSVGRSFLQPFSARFQAGWVLILFWLESEHGGKGLDTWVIEPDQEWLW